MPRLEDASSVPRRRTRWIGIFPPQGEAQPAWSVTVAVLCLALAALQAAPSSPLWDESFSVSLNTPGSVDSVFVQTNDQIIVAGDFQWIGKVPRNHVARLNSSAALDLAFDPGADFRGPVYSCALQPDGKLLLAGELHTGESGVFRYHPNGLRDQSFTTPFIGFSAGERRPSIQLDAVGRALVVGEFYFEGDRFWRHLARLNSDGTLDNRFALNMTTDWPPDYRRIFPQPDGSLLAITAEDYYCVRLHADGTYDRQLSNSRVEAVVPQADGKLLLVGEFYGPERHVMRLNEDLSVDASYSLMFSEPPQNAVALPDGRVLIQTANLVILGTNGAVERLVKNAGGTLPDAPENPAALEANGSLLLPSNWSLFATNQTNFGLIRLGASGQRDRTFKLRGGVMNPCGGVEVLPLGNGKVLVSGDFTHVNGHEHLGTVRLLDNGRIDASAVFVRGARLPLSGRSGRYFVGAGVLCGPHDCREALLRWFPDGKRDRQFSYTSFCVSIGQVFPLPAGKTLIATIPGPPCIHTGPRVTHYAVIDRFGKQVQRLSLDTDSLWGGEINVVVPWLNNGSVLLAGQFATVNGVPRGGVARLLSNGGIDESFNPPNLFQPIRTLHTVKMNRVGLVTWDNELVTLDSHGNALWMKTLPQMPRQVRTSWGHPYGSSFIAGEISDHETRLLHVSPAGHVIGMADVPFKKLSEYDDPPPVWVSDRGGRALIAGRSLLVNGSPFSGIKRLRSAALDHGRLEWQAGPGSSRATLQLHGVPGRTYLVEKSDAFTSTQTNWQPLAEATVPNSWTATVDVNMSMGGSNAPAEFYRMRLRLP